MCRLLHSYFLYSISIVKVWNVLFMCFYCCLVLATVLLLFALKYAPKEYKLYLLPKKKRFQWYGPWLLPLFHSLSFYSTIFPTGALFLTTLALLFLKQIPFLPYPKTLKLLFFWKCSSPRPAWLATSPVWASPMLFKSHNETLNPFPFLLLLKDTLSLYPLNSPA